MISLLEIIHKGYKLFISPVLESVFGIKCRFHPYCSDYALEAIKSYGIFKGGLLALKRFVRCAPYSKGGFDPVPKK